MAEVTLLGIAQDGGRPQPMCKKPCCANVGLDERAFPTSLGVKFEDSSTHLFDATRNLGDQLEIWQENYKFYFQYKKYISQLWKI